MTHLKDSRAKFLRRANDGKKKKKIIFKNFTLVSQSYTAVQII